MNSFYRRAISKNLFDSKWYQEKYKHNFESAEQAFAHHRRTERFSGLSPNPSFDTRCYLKQFPELLLSGESPMEHFLASGDPTAPLKVDERYWHPQPNTLVDADSSIDLSSKAIAVHLHIYYADFIERFASALTGMPFPFDLYITSSDETICNSAKARFGNIPSIRRVDSTLTPNRGRNFAPLLVSVADKLRNYDIFCHAHSKKSLYAGHELSQWADYLTEYLLRDKEVIVGALSRLCHRDIGLYFPTPFWNLPPWVSGWLKNKHSGRRVLLDWFGITDSREFFPYPVGGMFWAKTSALLPLINRSWSYDDFPIEPLPSDGALPHILERILPRIAEHAGHKTLFYHPPTATYSTDHTHVYEPYLSQSYDHLNESASQATFVSFDLFDTLVQRITYAPDYAKFLLPKTANIRISPSDFVSLRNQAELTLREQKHFVGDVSLVEIYHQMRLSTPSLNLPTNMPDLEFSVDLSLLAPKPRLAKLAKNLSAKKQVVLISDTYYSKIQIQQLLTRMGLTGFTHLFISSDLGRRKDSGAMWHFVRDYLKSMHYPRYLHVGDNVTSDCQIPGDVGLSTFHLLSPLDKWDALGFDASLLNEINTNPKTILKWGPLLAYYGEDPFL